MPQNLFLCHTVWAYVGTLRLHSVAGITEKNASPHIGVEFDRFTSSVRGGGVRNKYEIAEACLLGRRHA